MRISELIGLLNKLQSKHGDLPVHMLDDETGNYEAVSGAFYVQELPGNVAQIQLLSETQTEREEI